MKQVGCNEVDKSMNEMEEFDYTVEQFADLQLLRYKVYGFEELSLKQKKLIYYLSQAALQGRDILFDQNGKYNLLIRKMLETVYTEYQGDRTDVNFVNLETYLKRIWFSNGIHHHYASDKFVPGFTPEFFRDALNSVDALKLPLGKGETVEELCEEVFPVIFDSEMMPKRVNQADGEDLVLTSAANYYEGVTQKEAEDFYHNLKNPDDMMPVMFGMNSRLVKEDGKVQEKVWRSGGLYGQAIDKIIYWLDKALGVAEDAQQKIVIEKLIRFYKNGDLKDFDEYSIAWVKDLESRVDFVNGFIESYGDPLGLKASWESIVNFKDLEATKRTEIISANAQWFEDHSPVDHRFKKKEVKGVSAKVITAAMLGGDLYPATAIGINLPNSNWIRSVHGSKSVTIGNLTDAYNKAAHGNGFTDEFVCGAEEKEWIKKYADLTGDLHTDLHECLGHGSGQLLPGVSKYIEYPEFEDYITKRINGEWIGKVNEVKTRLQRGKEIAEQINILGDDGVPVEYHVTFWKSELIDFVILQQDAFDEIDAVTPMERQEEILNMVIDICHTEFEFDNFNEVMDYFKKMINICKQMNYSKFKSEEYDNFYKQLQELIEERKA